MSIRELLFSTELNLIITALDVLDIKYTVKSSYQFPYVRIDIKDALLLKKYIHIKKEVYISHEIRQKTLQKIIDKKIPCYFYIYYTENNSDYITAKFLIM